jgi:hypothetical protein
MVRVGDHRGAMVIAIVNLAQAELLREVAVEG